MQIAKRILLGLFIMVAIGLLLSIPESSASSQGEEVKPAAQILVSEPVVPALSRPVRDIPPHQLEATLNREINPIRNPGLFMADMGLPGSDSTDKDPLVELSQMDTGRTPTPLLTFEGLGTDGYTPPDTMGEVGPDHYVQMVNVSFAVYDKAGNILTGDTLFTDLFAGSGLTYCASQNDGDPVVLWDSMADRWLLSQFAVSTSPEHMCIAISQTPDPTGAYHLYQFEVPDFPDYFKFGVWPDAYYMGTNTGFPNQYYAYAFDREAMLAGQPATYQYSNGHPNFLLPADLDGSILPPAGSPGYFYTMLAEGYPNHPAGVDRLVLYEFSVDWDTPANSTFGIAQQIPIADYNYTTCGFFAGDCIPQPGTSQRLDAVDPWPMWRFAYRNLDSYEAMVGNFTVDTDGTDHAGIRWFELQKVGAEDWSLYQEGTHAPDDDHRWMGSIAMDGSGNIALGYSVSGLTTYPSLRYATRLRSDIPGTLQAETTLYGGGGSQTGPYDRWGDYSSMSIDPADECTFWYTGEYHDVSAESFYWNTRIGKFRLPSCTGTLESSGTLSGVVTDNSNGSPVNGTAINVLDGGDQIGSAVTMADGMYSINYLPPGSYDVSASAYGYLPTTINSVGISAGVATTLNIALTPASSFTVSGIVTDANTGWPLYARLDITGYPGSPIWTNPETGAYSVVLLEGETYDFTVSAWVDGYTNTTRSVGPLIGNVTENFALTANMMTCNAPGYTFITYFSHSFEGANTTFPFDNWEQLDTTGTAGNWTRPNSGSNPTALPRTGSNLARFNSFSASSGSSTRLHRTVDLNLSGASAPVLTFWMYHDTGYSTSNDRIQVQVSTDGSTWADVGTAVSRYIGSTGWQQHTVALNAYAGLSTVRIGFNAISAFGNNIYIDDVSVVEQDCIVPTGGLVIGNVYDGDLGNGLNGATVSNEDSYTTISAATPLDPNVDDGFYTLFSWPGPKQFAAIATGYLNGTATPTVLPGDTIRQDFTLSPNPFVFAVCATPNLAIPDGSTTGANTTLTIPQGGTIADVNLYLRGTHTYVGDLVFRLTHPNGTTAVTTLDRPGVPASTYGCNASNFDLWLDDTGTSGPVENQCSTTPPALYGQATPNNPLSAFNTLSANGTWTLNASDHATPDAGTVQEWCVQVTVAGDAWRGTQDSNWNNPQNWASGNVPPANYSVILDPAYLTGANAWPVLEVDPTVTNLTVESGAELTIPNGRTLTVNNTITNNGTLRQTIDNVNTATTFLGTGGYGGVVITPSGNMGLTTVEIRGGQDCTTNPTSQPVQRCFDIEPATDQLATIRFYYAASEANGNAENGISVYHWDGAGWAPEPGGHSHSSGADPRWVEVTGVDSYSPFVLDNNTPTAVTLQSVSANSLGTGTAVLPLLLVLAMVLLFTAGRVLRRR